jgi:serine/threonine protein kinase
MADDPLIGKQLDEYRLEALLGQGGMARVYRGLDVRLKRWVAIKVIDARFQTNSKYVMRFEREAQAIAQLEHPHIVRLYRYGEVKGLLYMAMQYIEGASLNHLLATYRAEEEFIEPDEANRIVRQVSLALDYAHHKGVIHRDVKPSNIVLNKQGQAILADFGLALLVDVGTRGEVFGTPRYMAPEQAMSSASTVPQSDLYALGVILYEMFTGQLPFNAEKPLDIAMLHLTEPPPPPREIRPELSPALEAVILKALAKEAQDRYPSGRALADALTQALQSAPNRVLSSLSPANAARLSIPERVEVSLVQRPLPPLPAAISDPPLVETQPPVYTLLESVPEAVKIGSEATPPVLGPTTAAAPASKPSPWPLSIFIGVGVGLLVIGLLLAAGLVVFLGLRSQANHIAAQPLPVETPLLAVASPVATTAGLVESTTSPAALPVEPAAPSPATATPLPQPQLIADSARDFSSSPGVWEYLSSPANENNFKPMKFEERKYGACWYDKDYIRICQGSGHPGNNVDVAWLWKSQASGHVRVLVSTHKIDRGGDGVTILAYPDDTSQSVEGLTLQGKDTEGVTQKVWFETDVGAGDSLIFVMKKNRSVEYDHTAFQVQIYQQ